MQHASRLARATLALASLILAGCNGEGLRAPGSGATGQSCSSNGDCAGNLCLLDAFPGGYCSADCSQVACGAGEICRQAAGNLRCFKGCAAKADCRDGYTCFQGACVPACRSDADCSRGYGCTGGECTALPGAPTGAGCGSDDDCSSRYCEPVTSTCQLACASDGACPGGQTCFVNPVDTDGNQATDALHPICIPARPGGGAVGAPCAKDAQCTRGSCQLGLCASMCEGMGNCGGTLGCYAMFAAVDEGGAPFRGCIPRRGVIDYDLGKDPNGIIGVPENAVSLGLFVEEQFQNISYYAGVTILNDPNQTIYSMSADFFENALRYQFAEGTSYLVVSNSPLVQLVPNSLYNFNPFAVNSQNNMNGTVRVRARLKVQEQPTVTSGTVSIHVFITDLSGGCKVFDAAGAPGLLAPWETQMRAIFQQARITIDEFKYFDSMASNVVTQKAAAISPDIDGLLKTATMGDAPETLELVVVKHINSDSQQQGFEVLGVAGGIPGSTGIPGTVHSGAALSLSSLCHDPSQKQFALTAAHELGHTLGLYHNVEQDGHTDQITDDDRDGQANLMYWQENGGLIQTHLSPQQIAAILVNPAVRP